MYAAGNNPGGGAGFGRPLWGAVTVVGHRGQFVWRTAVVSYFDS